MRRSARQHHNDQLFRCRVGSFVSLVVCGLLPCIDTVPRLCTRGCLLAWYSTSARSDIWVRAERNGTDKVALARLR